MIPLCVVFVASELDLIMSNHASIVGAYAQVPAGGGSRIPWPCA